MPEAAGKFVSRGGDKLDAALDAFDLNVSGRICADFGCNIGGFTNCLLQRGAARVYAVDTGYGTLAWKLRKDPHVIVMERTNALYCPVPEPVDLVVIDVAWTPQKLILPAAVSWLKHSCEDSHFPCVISLLKPHYELVKLKGKKVRSALSDSQAEEVCFEVCQQLARNGWAVDAAMKSPLLGKGGNVEFFIVLSEVSGRHLQKVGR